MFEKNKSLEVSEKFFKKLEEKLKDVDINGYYQTFNNCREQGLILKTYLDNVEVNIWAFECRNSDNIVIITGDQKDANINNMFSDKAYKNAKHFEYEDYDSAVDYVCKVLKAKYPNSFNTNKSYTFDMYKKLEDIERISVDCADLEYEDYYDLACFKDNAEKYLCDLIVYEGKMSLRYSKYESDDEIENLTIEEFDPDLTNEATLMLGMQEKLNKFVTNELEYDLEMTVGDVRI